MVLRGQPSGEDWRVLGFVAKKSPGWRHVPRYGFDGAQGLGGFAKRAGRR